MIANPLTKPSHEWSKSRKLMFLLCLVGLGYQLICISRQYYAYKTEIKTKFDQRNDKLDLPAITLCIPRALTYLKKSLSTRYPELNKTLDLIDKINTSRESKEYYKDMIYFKYVEEKGSEKFFNNSIKDEEFIECYLNEPTIRMLNKKWFLSYTECSAIQPILESQVQSYGKCFTYFSQQYSKIKDFTDFQIKPTLSTILDLFISFNVFEDALNYNLLSNRVSQTSVYLFIHQANTLPSFDPNDAIELEPGKQYDIAFKKSSKTLLRAPYDTDCFNYSKQFTTDSPKSSDQCVRHCHREKSKSSFFSCISQVDVIANDYALKNQRVKSCTTANAYYFSQRLLNECTKSCKQDCKQIDYIVNSRKFDHNFKKAISAREKVSTKFSLVQLRYKGNGDIEYQYKPELTFNQFIERLIITVIVWFGLSIFSCFAVFEMAFIKAKPHISTDDKVSPHVISVMPQSIPISTKFMPSQVGSNVKLDHYNSFIAKVVDGYPAHKVDLPSNK